MTKKKRRDNGGCNITASHGDAPQRLTGQSPMLSRSPQGQGVAPAPVGVPQAGRIRLEDMGRTVARCSTPALPQMVQLATCGRFGNRHQIRRVDIP